MKNLGLTYCTNVHPLGDWASWSDLIGRFGSAVRSRTEWAMQPMGLWFPAALVEELELHPKKSRDAIRALFSGNRLTAFTCNAFPYGNFHEAEVKTKVYRPDWTTPERLAYTIACAKLLSLLIPWGEDGSVSTLPLGWRIGWSEDHSRRSAGNLCAYIKAARALRDIGGMTLRLGLEPEPGCVLETTDQAIAFWERHLRPAAQAAGIAADDLAAFCGLCYDTCHQAVQFEDPVEVLDRLAAHGIPIVKMQLSSALELPPDPDRTSLELRRQFVEPRFLHQTRVRTPEGIVSFDDLPELLGAADEAKGAVGAPGAASASAGAGAVPGTTNAPTHDLWAYPWRVHYHLPIDTESMLGSGNIATTRGDMVKAYQHAVVNGMCRHFEVETYTWSVLPEAHRPKDDSDLADALARELAFIGSRTPAGYRTDV